MPLLSKAIDYVGLKARIQNDHLNSIPATLEALPEADRSKYVLMFKSRSLHESSSTAPRVLLYGSDAKFIISFNGEPSQRGFNALETSEFDDQKQEFNYREILFPENGKGQVTFSKSNPEKCMKCHGNPTRPIWDTHPLWPGAYGERYRAPLSESEREGLAQFIALQPQHPRYRTLLNMERFSNKETFYPSAKTLYDGTNKESPNEELSRLLSRQNAKRIVQIVKQSPKFPIFSYTLLGAVSRDCGKIEDFIPLKYRSDFAEKWQSFSKMADAKNEEQERLKRQRSVSFDYKPDETSRSEVIALNAFCFLTEQGMGLSSKQWTTAFEEGTFDFKSPQPIDSEFEKQLLSTLKEHDPELSKLAALGRVSSNDKYCAYLRKKSLASLENLQSFGQADVPLELALTRPPAINKCIDCHQGQVGPLIPFASPERLAALLNQGHYPRGTLLKEILFRLSPEAGSDRMPKGINLSAQEQSEVERYFRSLQDRQPAGQP